MSPLGYGKPGQRDMPQARGSSAAASHKHPVSVSLKTSSHPDLDSAELSDFSDEDDDDEDRYGDHTKPGPSGGVKTHQQPVSAARNNHTTHSSDLYRSATNSAKGKPSNSDIIGNYLYYFLIELSISVVMDFYG